MAATRTPATQATPKPGPPTKDIETAVLDALDKIGADLESLSRAYRHTQTSITANNPERPLTDHSARTRVFQLAEYSRALLFAAVPQAIGQHGPLSHVVVFGGTQVGKSTAINVLTGREAARVHHTAGFTRHAQAFIPPDADPDDLFGPNPHPLSRFHRTEYANLSNDRLTEYSVEGLPQVPSIGNLVLWDAPDCDAVGSHSYLPGMVEALALADVIVYVTSGQKYAIRHVLEWVVELQSSGKPLIALLNMAPRAHQSDLLLSMQRAIHTVATEVAADLTIAPPPSAELPAVAFEFVPDGDSSILTAREYQPGQQLRDAVRSAADHASTDEARNRKSIHAIDYVLQRLPVLTGPALAETQAREEFLTLTNDAVASFVRDYQVNYLDNPESYDAFSLVGLEILKLLDPPIPGARQAITAIRSVIGIPARLLVMGAKSIYGTLNNKAGQNSQTSGPPELRDTVAVRSAHQSLLNQISREVTRRANEAGSNVAFWKALDWAWERAISDIEAEFRVQARRLEETHTATIRETASRIYTEIARDPVKLNLLRTGRLSADAAAIVLSIKTGGHGGELLHSAIFAPVLLSVTEAAAQMIADNHVSGLRDQLRHGLLDETRQLGQRVYTPRLEAVANEAATLAGISQLDGSALRSLPERLHQLRTLVAGRVSS